MSFPRLYAVGSWFAECNRPADNSDCRANCCRSGLERQLQVVGSIPTCVGWRSSSSPSAFQRRCSVMARESAPPRTGSLPRKDHSFSRIHASVLFLIAPNTVGVPPSPSPALLRIRLDSVEPVRSGGVVVWHHPCSTSGQLCPRM